MAGPLIVCPSCSTHVLVRDAGCPHCGATVRSGGAVLGRTAGAVLMGLTLAGCPASDDTSETMGNGETSSTTAPPTSSTTDDSGSTSFDVSTGPVGEAYGSPETTDTLGTSSGGDTEGTSSGSGSSSGSGTDTDTDSGSSTGISPDYGVPTTGE